MNWLDAAILAMLLASTMMGVYWGLIRQILSILGLVGGIFLAGRYYEPVAVILQGGPDSISLVPDPNWARIVAFAAIMIGFSLILGIAGSILRVAVQILFLGWLDHTLGGLLGLVTSTILIMTLLIVATVFPIPELSNTIKESTVAQLLSGLVPVILAMLPPEFNEFRRLIGWGPV